jgi:photosystem II stability/assembly factor-like uncharacterized protein
VAHEREGEEDRERRQLERQAWIESMHKAAPDVDWREIERGNSEAEMRRRAELKRLGAVETSFGIWSEVGSRNQAGRMHAATFGPPNAAAEGGRYLYAGSSLGGVWRGEIDGTEWTPIADNRYGGGHELIVLPPAVPGDPDIVLVTTDGGDVHVTFDGGESWQEPLGIPDIHAVRSVGVLDDASRTILLYVIRPTGIPRIYASTDSGASFTMRWAGGSAFQGSMWVPRTGPLAASTVFLAHLGQILRSDDGGTTFNLLQTVSAAATSAVLTGSEAGNPTLYAALFGMGSWKLYRSDDAVNFAFVANLGDFWEALCASTLDPNLVMYGGVEVWRSNNGGGSFTRINRWFDYYDDPANKLHADIMGLHCLRDPEDPLFSEVWFLSTDGGVYESRDGGLTVQNRCLEGLGVSQYYSTLTSSGDPSVILAGSQDQGYQRGVFEPGSGDGPSTDFNQLISGDYGHLTSSDGTHFRVFSTYPGFILFQRGYGGANLHQVSYPPNTNQAWLPPVVADPLSVGTFYFLANQLWRYVNTNGGSFTFSLHSTHNFLVGGASYLTAMAFAPSDANRVYAANESGRLFFSTDHGVTWTNSASIGPLPHYFYGSAIAVHPSDAMEAAVGGSGYSTAGVRRTLDGGVSWNALDQGLPQTLVYDLVYALDGSGDIYAATEAGPYRYNRSLGSWQSLHRSGTPITLYWSVEALVGGEVIRFGTYGRGIWDFRILPVGDPDSYTGPLRRATIGS